MKIIICIALMVLSIYLGFTIEPGVPVAAEGGPFNSVRR